MVWLRLGGFSLDSLLLIPSTHHGRKKLKSLFGDAVKQRDDGLVGKLHHQHDDDDDDDD